MCFIKPTSHTKCYTNRIKVICLTLLFIYNTQNGFNCHCTGVISSELTPPDENAFVITTVYLLEK